MDAGVLEQTKAAHQQLIEEYCRKTGATPGPGYSDKFYVEWALRTLADHFESELEQVRQMPATKLRNQLNQAQTAIDP